MKVVLIGQTMHCAECLAYAWAQLIAVLNLLQVFDDRDAPTSSGLTPSGQKSISVLSKLDVNFLLVIPPTHACSGEPVEIV
jgi:hypothetical protein